MSLQNDFKLNPSGAAATFLGVHAIDKSSASIQVSAGYSIDKASQNPLVDHRCQSGIINQIDLKIRQRSPKVCRLSKKHWPCCANTPCLPKDGRRQPPPRSNPSWHGSKLRSRGLTDKRRQTQAAP